MPVSDIGGMASGCGEWMLRLMDARMGYGWPGCGSAWVMVIRLQDTCTGLQVTHLFEGRFSG